LAGSSMGALKTSAHAMSTTVRRIIASISE
jgi:hypothetical protein